MLLRLRMSITPCGRVTEEGEFLGAGNVCFSIWVLVTQVCSAGKNSSVVHLGYLCFSVGVLDFNPRFKLWYLLS